MGEKIRILCDGDPYMRKCAEVCRGEQNIEVHRGVQGVRRGLFYTIAKI